MMKVLVFETFALYTPHFETTLELMETHMLRGDDVKFVQCNAELPSCDVNIYHDLTTCMLCISKRNNGLRTLSRYPERLSIVSLNTSKKRTLKSLRTEFKDIKELCAYKIDDFDIGYAVASSLITSMRDPEPDLGRFKKIMVRLLKASYAVYLSTIEYIKIEKPDVIYVFNGRFAPLRAVLRAAQASGVDCYTHERGSDRNKYALIKNEMIHDSNVARKLITDFWENKGEEQGFKLAEEFYSVRRKGIMKTWHSFTANQNELLLPENWDGNKSNIVIYTSSDDEFAAINDSWYNPIYESQFDGLKKIIGSISSFKNHFRIYIRMHPNQQGVARKQTEQILGLKNEFVTIIAPKDSVSTYKIMQEADKVLSFGSTTGIEAAYWGKVSILSGMSWYKGLGSTYEPSSHDALINMLLDKSLKPLPNRGAAMFGAYMGNFGIPYKFFHERGLFDGTFKNVKLRPSIGIRALNKIVLKAPGVNWLRRKLENIHAESLY